MTSARDVRNLYNMNRRYLTPSITHSCWACSVLSDCLDESETCVHVESAGSTIAEISHALRRRHYSIDRIASAQNITVERAIKALEEEVA